MIKINASHIDWKEIKNEHYNHMREKFLKWLEANKEQGFFKHVRNYFWDHDDQLQENRVRDILVGDIKKLREIMNEIGVVKNSVTLSIDTPYKHITQSGSASSYGYRYLKKLKLDVCPYCNMQYTFTIEEAKRRAQFDHFFPKSKYSYLQASLFNLIPSCQPCNSAKGEKVPGDEVYYPFDKGMGEDVYFQTKLTHGIESLDFSHWLGFEGDFEIELVAKADDETGKKYIEGVQEFFKLQDLYKEHHNDYVRDIIKNLIIYDESKIEELQQNFSGLFETREDVLDVVLMNRIQINDWGKRPLAKLTHDIYQEFKEE